VCYSSDDEEDDEEEEEEGEKQVKKEGEVKSEVKTEPGTGKKKSKDSNELHTYLEDELKLFKLNQLTADVQLLDGASVATRDFSVLTDSYDRETAEGQTKSRGPQGVQEARGRMDETGTGRRGHDKTAGHSEATLRSAEETAVGRVHDRIHGYFVQAEGDVSGLHFL
jgi:hypothetical protein